VFNRKPLELAYYPRQLRQQNLQPIAQEHEIRIVRHVATGCPPVNNTCCSRRFQAETMHVRHDIVAAFLFLFGDDGEFVVLDDLGGCHLRDCVVADVEAELFFAFG